MSPSKFQDSEATANGMMINGSRPSQLRINRDSHSIHKSPENSSHSSVQKHSTKRPVIIYTHSPKIIHAKARDFMALVQKLTGLSRSEDEKTVKSESGSNKDDDEIKDCGGGGGKNVGYEDNESSSVLTDEKFEPETKHDFSAVSPMSNSPLLALNSNEFLCSLTPNSMFQPTNPISHAAYMDFMNGFPEY